MSVIQLSHYYCHDCIYCRPTDGIFTSSSPVTPIQHKPYTDIHYTEPFVLPPSVVPAIVRPSSSHILSHTNSVCSTPHTNTTAQYRDTVIDSAQTSDGEESDTASVVHRALAVQSDTSTGSNTKKLRVVN